MVMQWCCSATQSAALASLPVIYIYIFIYCSIVAVVLQWCCSCGAVVLQWCCSGVAVVLQCAPLRATRSAAKTPLSVSHVSHVSHVKACNVTYE